MQYRWYIVILICILQVGQACGLVEITGGWSFEGNGEFSSHGVSEVSGCGSDPSITLGITSTSSICNGGNISDLKIGSQAITITVGGYQLTAGYDGEVRSSINGRGTGATTAFVGATATGLSTGGDSYDIFGSADISTDGYLSGTGIGEASASGTSQYRVIKIGTPSEVWGQVAGMSELRMDGRSSDSLASTGGYENGLHTESRVRKTISGETVSGKEMASSTSRINSYASVINEARINVSSSGTAESGGWVPGFSQTKEQMRNENVASSSTGDLWGYVEANGYLDAADVSAILESTASMDNSLYVSGSPATYAASTQSSSAVRTYAETWVRNASWGSAAREGNRTAREWGNLSDLGSGAHMYEPGADAVSFGNIRMIIDYQDDPVLSTGFMKLDTYAEATKNKTAMAGSIIGYTGDGTMYYQDDDMLNTAGFVGGLDHHSWIAAGRQFADTSALLGRAYVETNPQGNESLIQPWRADTSSDPNVAWSRTEGSFRNPS